MIAQEICSTIVKCLQNVWTDKMLFDFTVKIDDETIQCHRLILAACSEFFKALFRSGMREVTENCVVLQDVSSDVFQIILQTLYTGENILTLHNLFDVWRAVHMLQIPFMINMCEDFAIEALTIDTWENIYSTAKVVGSGRIIKKLQLFMLQYFEVISRSPTFIQFSYKEIQDLIKSQDLVVSSEDLVMESVIRWVTCDPKMMGQNNENNIEINDGASLDDDQSISKTTMIENIISCKTLVTNETSSRKDKLTELLKKVRTCLVRPAVLSQVLKMDLVLENKESREIIVDAMSYHVQDVRHGQWSSGAIHRSCSEYIQGGVCATPNGSLQVLSACEETWHFIPQCKFLQGSIQLVTFDGELFATGKQRNQPNAPCRMFVFCDSTWKEVMEMPSHNLLLVSHGDFIYIINKDNNFISLVNTKKKIPKLDIFTIFREQVHVHQATFVQDCLLLFCSKTHNSNDETAVYKFDILSKVWTRLDNINGPASHMVSFRCDQHNYILQTNGSLWLILNSTFDKNIEFKFLVKLWKSEEVLHGAFTYESKLVIYGRDQDQDSHDTSLPDKVPGHFKSISHWVSAYSRSNLVPVTLLRKCLF